MAGTRLTLNQKFTTKTRCRKTNTYPRAGHDRLPELWETICQAPYRPSPSSTNPQKVCSRYQRKSTTLERTMVAEQKPSIRNLYSAPLFPLSFTLFLSLFLSLSPPSLSFQFFSRIFFAEYSQVENLWNDSLSPQIAMFA